MEENSNGHEHFDASWGEVIRTYYELMDDLLLYLTPAAQIVYQHLFRLSHVRQSPFAKGRYEELAVQCRISLRTLQRALKGLRQKKLVSTVWHSHGATTFTVRLLSQLSQRPAFLPRRKRGEFPSSLQTRPLRPPVYDAFSPEDRALFIDCKQCLGPARLNDVTEVAVEWLTARCEGNPEAFSDELLRDKIDEPIFNEVFGPERRKPYEGLFKHLYQGFEDELCQT